jgi:hypothetical protein
MDVRVDQITAVEFAREPNPFPHSEGQESLIVRFLGPSDSVLSCYLDELLDELYDDDETLRSDKLAAWESLRERYASRDAAPCLSRRLDPVSRYPASKEPHSAEVGPTV